MSDFLTDKQMTSQKGDAAAKARAAREARQRLLAERGTAQQQQEQETAAKRIQRSARRFLLLLRNREVMQGEWDAAVAKFSTPTAGQQLALCTWLLRFFSPRSDGERLRVLCRVIVDGMEQTQPPRMFASTALRKELALHWVSALRRLLIAASRMVHPSEGHVSELLAEVCTTARSPGKASIAPSQASAAITAAKKRLSVTFGPVLRLLLLLCEPEKWKLVVQLQAAGPAGQPAAQALILMAQSAVTAADEKLVGAAGALALAVHADADVALLSAAVAVAALPLQMEGAPTQPAVKTFVYGGLLSVPALMTRVATAANRLNKGSLIWARVTEAGTSLAAHAERGAASSIDPDLLLCITANLLALLPTQPPPTAKQLVGLAKLVEALLRLQPTVAGAASGQSSSGAGSSSGGSYFHQIRGWTSKPPSPGIAPHLEVVASGLSALWSPKLLSLLYSDALAVPLGTKPLDAAIDKLNAEGLQALAARAQIGAQMHVTALRALTPQRVTLLSRLAYSSYLLPAIWALMRALDQCKAAPLFRVADDVIRDPLAAPAVPLLILLLEAGIPLLSVLSDRELHEDGQPFSKESLSALAAFLNRLAFRFVWELSDDASPLPSSAASSFGLAIGVSAAMTGGSAANALRRSLRDSCVSLLALLAERDARRPFCPDGLWLITELRYSELHRELLEQKPRAKRLLNSLPWALPFERRVNVFRELVQKEKESLPGEDLPEHMKGHRVKIRREQLLEDGYVQMGNLQMEQLKGTIRVEFVNRMGLGEAGIDRTGVFKEFMEDVCKKAFDPNLGLFKQSEAQFLYPSPTSEQADSSHLRYFEFVGRMLGKAVYEGIVLEVPLADFFALKLLGRPATLDELPSLDPELAQHLDFLKRYDGDVETDLCLTFSVDDDEFGKRTTVDLKDGGRCVNVTNDNRIEYVHLMAEYRLNGQVAKQSKAFLHGMHAVVPPGWLRLFNRPELQRLISGDDVPIDVTDLRKHTKYAGGYNDLSPTIRDLWSVLNDFSKEDRGLFLKFVTSCSKPPLLGFAHLHPSFTVQCVASDGGEIPSVLAFFGMGRKETSRLPTSATCFNLLKLPNFKSKKVLKERLLYAIKSESGFDLS